VQKSLFGDPELPLHEAVEAYQHEMDWANRLILGDSLLVMNSLLERERMAGQVQMIYIDPPYGIGYNSNFQPRVDRRDVKDGKGEDLTREPEQIRAYRDTWTLGIHSYLTYLRDRLLVAKELLSETGSVFVQIGQDNLHTVRVVLDEVFGAENFVALIPFRKKTMPLGGAAIEQMDDFLIWYAKSKQDMRYRPLFLHQSVEGDWNYQWAQLPDGSVVQLTREQIRNHALAPKDARLYMLKSLEPSGPMASGMVDFEFEGRVFPHPRNGWATPPEGLWRLAVARRLAVDGNRLTYKLFADDYPVSPVTAPWQDTIGPRDKRFVVQTSSKVVARCLLMTTDPGDLVMDPTCGSGTTAFVAEQWGRRWITCDTSRVAVFLARQRLLTAKFDYYDLADEEQGVAGGFKYTMAPHITLKSIANNPELDPDKVAARREDIRTQHPDATDQEIERLLREANEEIIRANADQETLYDQPKVVRNKVRVSGPFTVEAIPPPSLEAMEETPIGGEPEGTASSLPDPLSFADDALERGSTATTEHIETLTEQLRKDGVLFPDNKHMVFASVTGCGGGVIHAEGELANGGENGLKRVAISFGPLYGAVTGRQVEDGLREARIGGYDGIIFCGFAFDAEAQATISQYANPKLRAFLAHARPDMLMTDDRGQSLLKTTASSQLFTVFGEPDVEVNETAEGHVVRLLGVDVYDPVSGTVSSEGAARVAAWFVDTDYDGRTFCVCQAFFPDRSAWRKLGKALKGTLDPERLEMLSGTTSLPFAPGKHRRVAVKVIDRRGNEVMVVRPLYGPG
jgi:adenine-specific DNA-methyltransferase